MSWMEHKQAKPHEQPVHSPVRSFVQRTYLYLLSEHRVRQSVRPARIVHSFFLSSCYTHANCLTEMTTTKTQEDHEKMWMRMVGPRTKRYAEILILRLLCFAVHSVCLWLNDCAYPRPHYTTLHNPP